MRLAPTMALSVAVPVSLSLPAIRRAVPDNVTSVVGVLPLRAASARWRYCTACGLVVCGAAVGISNDAARTKERRRGKCMGTSVWLDSTGPFHERSRGYNRGLIREQR